MHAPNARERFAYADPASYVWKKNTLYHELHDNEVTVLGMIRQDHPRENIQQAIQDMRKHGTIDAATETSLM